MKNAGDKRLIRKAFFHSSSLQFDKVFLRNPDIDSLILTESRPGIFLVNAWFLSRPQELSSILRVRQNQEFLFRLYLVSLRFPL